MPVSIVNHIDIIFMSGGVYSDKKVLSNSKKVLCLDKKVLSNSKMVLCLDKKVLCSDKKVL